MSTALMHQFGSPKRARNKAKVCSPSLSVRARVPLAHARPFLLVECQAFVVALFSPFTHGGCFDSCAKGLPSLLFFVPVSAYFQLSVLLVIFPCCIYESFCRFAEGLPSVFVFHYFQTGSFCRLHFEPSEKKSNCVRKLILIDHFRNRMHYPRTPPSGGYLGYKHIPFIWNTSKIEYLTFVYCTSFS